MKHEPAPCFGFTPDSTFPVTYGEKGHVNIFLSAVFGEQPANGLKLVIPEITQPLYYPKESFLVTTLTEIFCRQFGKDVAPMTTGGGTYAKTMPNTVAFGMAFPGGISKGEHEADEKLDLDELALATKILAEAMIKLAQ